MGTKNVKLIDKFLVLFRDSLSLIDNRYYGLHYWNDSMLNYHKVEKESEQRKSLKNYLDRYGERVFCYELYHQLRKLIESYEINHSQAFMDIALQGELKKDDIGDIVHLFGDKEIQKLDHEYIPDFLLHSPGNFDSQLLIIEVKSNPELTFSGMKEDFLKIQEFILKYKYERGVFLTVNTNKERIINALKQDENRDWIKTNIHSPELIHFMCKKKNDVELFECILDKLPLI